MLRNAYVTINDDKSVSLGQAFDKYNESRRKGGTNFDVTLKTYDPQRNTWKFQRPTYFRTKNDVSSLVAVELVTKEDKDGKATKFYTFITDVTTKVLASVGLGRSHYTGVIASALMNLRSSQAARVAYMNPKTKEIEYLRVSRVYDPVKDANDFNNEELKRATAEKREPKLKAVPHADSGDVLVIQVNDSAFVQCDNVFMM